MSGFFTSDRNKLFLAGVVTCFASVYIKDRFPITDAQIDAALNLLGFLILGHSIRKPSDPQKAGA